VLVTPSMRLCDCCKRQSLVLHHQLAGFERLCKLKDRLLIALGRHWPLCFFFAWYNQPYPVSFSGALGTVRLAIFDYP